MAVNSAEFEALKLSTIKLLDILSLEGGGNCDNERLSYLVADAVGRVHAMAGKLAIKQGISWTVVCKASEQYYAEG